MYIYQETKMYTYQETKVYNLPRNQDVYLPRNQDVYYQETKIKKPRHMYLYLYITYNTTLPCTHASCMDCLLSYLPVVQSGISLHIAMCAADAKGRVSLHFIMSYYVLAWHKCSLREFFFIHAYDTHTILCTLQKYTINK